MRVLTGKVIGGEIVVDGELPPDGTRVLVCFFDDDEPVTLTPAERQVIAESFASGILEDGRDAADALDDDDDEATSTT